MSESYTAEQLVAFLNKWMGGILTLYIAGENAGKQGVMREKEEFKAIIARLRAGDALCAAAVPIAGEISSFDDNDRTEYQVIRFKDLVRLRKAIAEYEEA